MRVPMLMPDSSMRATTSGSSACTCAVCVGAGVYTLACVCAGESVSMGTIFAPPEQPAASSISAASSAQSSFLFIFCTSCSEDPSSLS